jgi:phosphatidylglycerol:prolipoprotein diacylglycerol transferase
MINLPSGGLTYYGGFLLAFPTLVLYAKWKKVPLRLGMDIMAPAIVVALGFGRIGCFLNGCCYGAQCNLPWAVHYPYGSGAYMEEAERGQIPIPDERLVAGVTSDGWVPKEPARLVGEGDAVARQIAASQHSLRLHPAQLYSTFTCFLLAAMLYAYFTMPHTPGRVFALMLILEGGTRYLLELVRAEPAVFGRFSLSMLIGVGLVGLGGLLWFVFGRMSGVRFIARAGGAT